MGSKIGVDLSGYILCTICFQEQTSSSGIWMYSRQLHPVLLAWFVGLQKVPGGQGDGSVVEHMLGIFWCPSILGTKNKHILQIKQTVLLLSTSFHASSFPAKPVGRLSCFQVPCYGSFTPLANSHSIPLYFLISILFLCSSKLLLAMGFLYPRQR